MVYWNVLHGRLLLKVKNMDIYVLIVSGLLLRHLLILNILVKLMKNRIRQFVNVDLNHAVLLGLAALHNAQNASQRLW